MDSQATVHPLKGHQPSKTLNLFTLGTSFGYGFIGTHLLQFYGHSLPLQANKVYDKVVQDKGEIRGLSKLLDVINGKLLLN